MKILVVGSGGREHAIIWKIAQSKKVEKIYCAPGNGGISELAECVDINVMDKEKMVAFARDNKIDLVMVAPDDPLVDGMVDAMEKEGIREGSKAFSKDLMKKYNIPTAGYEVFTDSDKAIEYVKKGTFPTVIKADGLALGKGVIIAQNLKEAEDAIHEMIDNGKFGKSGSRVVVEEFLTGPEVS